MKKLVIAAGGIVIVIVAGFFLYRHFVINSIMDGPFMENITPDESEAEPEQKPASASAQEPESASARETESTIARALPETAALMEFSWHQSAMNHDDCFDFWMKTTDQDPEQPYLYCSYTNPETRERIELGDEMFIYRVGQQKKAEPGAKSESGVTAETELAHCPRIPHERWMELSDFLRKAELSPYRSPDPQLLDGTDSKLEFTWSADGQQITETFDGRSADGLFKLLQDITQGV